MDCALRARRRRSHPQPEALEGRALLASINAGALDPSFGVRGQVAVPIAPIGTTQTPSPAGNAVDHGGRVVVAATYSQGGATYESLERLTAAGLLDPTFGQGGQVSFKIDSTGLGISPFGLTLGPDGSIYQNVELASKMFGVVKFNSVGSLDTTYGVNGIATLPATVDGNLSPYFLDALTVTPGGQVLIAGSAEDLSTQNDNLITTAIFVDRLNANGSIDTSFGTSGVATIPVILNGFEHARASGLIVQASGRIVVAGVAVNGQVPLSINAPQLMDQEIPVLVGLTAAGALDPTFGPALSGGIAVLPKSLSPFGSVPDLANDSITQQADGQLVLVVNDRTQGDVQQVSNNLVRLTVDGRLDPLFGVGGVAPITGVLQPVGVDIEPDGKLVVAGYVNAAVSTYPGSQDTAFAVGRFLSNGSLDASFGQPATPGLAVYPTAYADAILGGAIFNSPGEMTLIGYSQSVAEPLNSTNRIHLVRAFTSATNLVTPPIAQPAADLVGTGTTDLSVYLTASGTFASLPTTGGAGQVVQFGVAGPGQTIPAVADYQGLGHSQIGAYLTASGVYAIQPTATSPGLLLPFGTPGAGQTIPVPADYEGTGKADVAVYLTASGTFAILPSDGSAGKLIQFGASGVGQSIPVPADYYGTGQTDVAVYLAAQGAFAVKDPTGNTLGEVVPFGKPGLGNSFPVPGDYDGSGHVEFAVYVPSQGAFYYRPYIRELTFQQIPNVLTPDVRVSFGTANSGAIPVPGDYDGSGRTEFALYNPATATLTYRPAFGGPDVTQSFGTPGGSVPVAALAGNLPPFSGGTISGSSAISRSIVAGPILGATVPGMAASAVISKASALPGGPSLSTKQVTPARVNQAVVDPWKS
jgi:uncharacterized delta-60 repeat protein